jgi:hypothetical protein
MPCAISPDDSRFFCHKRGLCRSKKGKDKQDTSVKCEREMFKENTGQKPGITAPEGP